MEDEAADDRDSEDHQFTMEALLNAPPMHHIMHNATNGLQQALRLYQKYVRGCTALCRVLRKRQHKTKVLARLFSATPLLQEFGEIIKDFKGWVHDKRWGTLVFSIPELRKVEGVLRRAWDLSQFTSGAATTEDRGKEGLGALAEEVDLYTRGPLFWGWAGHD